MIAGQLDLGASHLIVALVLEPFDQVERVDPVAQYETAEPFFQLFWGEGALQQADAVGYDDGADAIGVLALGQVNERLQPLGRGLTVAVYLRSCRTPRAKPRQP